MKEREEEMRGELVTPGEVLGKAAEFQAGKGAYVSTNKHTVYASLTGFRTLTYPPPDSRDWRPKVDVTGHKAHGAVPEIGAVVFARVTKVMARIASADIMCVGLKSVREKFTGIIRFDEMNAPCYCGIYLNNIGCFSWLLHPSKLAKDGGEKNYVGGTSRVRILRRRIWSSSVEMHSDPGQFGHIPRFTLTPRPRSRQATRCQIY